MARPMLDWESHAKRVSWENKGSRGQETIYKEWLYEVPGLPH